jgi:hypothetical protein
MPDDHDWLHRARRDLYHRLPVAAVAFSADGQDVHWAGPLDIGIEAAEIAIAERDDGTLVVIQVRDTCIGRARRPRAVPEPRQRRLLPPDGVAIRIVLRSTEERFLHHISRFCVLLSQ